MVPNNSIDYVTACYIGMVPDNSVDYSTTCYIRKADIFQRVVKQLLYKTLYSVRC